MYFALIFCIITARKEKKVLVCGYGYYYSVHVGLPKVMHVGKIVLAPSIVYKRVVDTEQALCVQFWKAEGALDYTKKVFITKLESLMYLDDIASLNTEKSVIDFFSNVIFKQLFKCNIQRR